MGVTHIVIHPTSRLTLLLSRRVLSRAPPRAAFSGACSRARVAASPPWAAGSPRVAVFGGASVASAAAAAAASSWALWLDPTCSGRGGGGRTLGSFELDPNPISLLLLRVGSVRAVPRAHAAATTNQTCLVCSVLAFSVY